MVPQCGSNTNETFSAGALYTQLKYYETLFDMTVSRLFSIVKCGCMAVLLLLSLCSYPSLLLLRCFFVVSLISFFTLDRNGAKN